MSARKQWQRIREGVIGEFQPLTTPPSPTGSGLMRLTDEHAEVVFAAGEAHFDDDHLPQDCGAVFGRTEIGDVLLMSIAQRSASWGETSTSRYRSRCVVLDPVQEDVDDDTVVSTRLHYYGLSAWSGDRYLTDGPIHENGRIVGWSAELRWHPGTTTPLDNGFSLRFGAGHTVTGPYDRRTLTAPLLITVESEQRRPIGEHLARLDAVHALLSVAHREPLLAADGGARFTHTQQGFCPMWERTMVSPRDHDHRQAAWRDEHTHDFPFFGLDDVGGTGGVASWVRLAMVDRRAVEPVVRHVLFPTQTPEARLLSTAAAMEYWVGSRAGTEAWARKRQGEDLPAALGRVVDPAWVEWIGDPKRWVKDFWRTYLDLKHFRGPAPDPRRVHALEISGRWLLTAALLDHCASTPLASRHLFEQGLGIVGGQVREQLWGPP